MHGERPPRFLPVYSTYNSCVGEVAGRAGRRHRGTAPRLIGSVKSGRQLM